jgi:hypothetical protein
MNWFVSFLLLISFFGPLPSSMSQNTFNGSMYGLLGRPISGMKNSLFEDRSIPGFGAGFNILANPKGRDRFSPIHLGIEFNYIYLGKEKIEKSYSLPQLKTNYNFFGIGPIFRYLTVDREEGFVPFLDAGFGWKILSTTTQIDNTFADTIFNEEDLTSLLTTEFGGLGLNFGIGFFNKNLPQENSLNSGSFYMKLMYQYGDALNFVKKGSIAVDSSGNFSYQTGRTKTSMILLQIGLAIH